MKIFVTTELYPFTAGGIGRVIGNLLSSFSETERARWCVLCLDLMIDPIQFSAVYPGVRFVPIKEADYKLLDSNGNIYPPKWAFTDSIWHWHSVRVMQALSDISKESDSIEYIEFPDWGGLGFASIQEKKLSRHFIQATLAVRLHSTDGLLADYEHRDVDSHALCLHDLERKSLADCDIIIAQLAPIGDAVKNFYGFDSDSWDNRLKIHAPLVSVDHIRKGDNSVIFEEQTPIVFSSKIQHIKRPEIMIRGCVGFIICTPEWEGKVIFLAHAFDALYEEKVRSLIPNSLVDRFVFLKSCGQTERNIIIAESVCVFPSVYESFCLAAYEASISGALVIVNEENPAFGSNTPWSAPDNCRKFRGTAAALSSALKNAFLERAQSRRVKPPLDALPWDIKSYKDVICCHDEYNASARRPLVSVIIPYYNMGEYILQTLDSVLASTYSNMEVIIIDDGSCEPASVEILDKIGGGDVPVIRIIKNGFNCGLSATRNHGLSAAQGEYILTIDADDYISAGFIEICVRALERERAYTFVITQAAFFEDGKNILICGEADHIDYAVFIGDARTIGLHENRFSTATVFGRAEAFKEIKYDEALQSYEDWEFYSRVICNGYRVIVTSDINFFYRRRSNSMIHSQVALENAHLHRKARLRGKAVHIGKNRIPMYGLASPVTGHALQNKNNIAADSFPGVGGNKELEQYKAELELYKNSEVVIASLKIVNAVNLRFPWVVIVMKNFALFSWRVYKKISVYRSKKLP